MSFILRRFVAGIAVFVGLLVYSGLRDFPWGIDLAICVGFTVEVIGLVATARILATPPLKPLKPMQQMLLIHGGFLAGAIVIERIFPLIQAMVPGGPVQHGRQGSWALLVAVTIITILGYAERWVLLSGLKSTSSLPWADEAITPLVSAPVFDLGAMSAPTINGVPMPSPPASQPEPAVIFAAAPPVVAPMATAPVAYSYESSSPAAPVTYMNSSGDDFEEFRQHLSQPKRPFRRPGITVKQEYELWLAAKSLGSTPAAKPRSGLSKFLLGEKAE